MSLHILMSGDTVGGVWTYCMDLIRALGGCGVSATLATMGPPPSASQAREAASSPNLDLQESSYALEWMPAPWDEVDSAGEWLLDLAARLRPDVIHLNGYVHAALPWRVPAMVAAHSCVLSWWKAVKRSSPPAEWDEYQRRVEAGLSSAALVVAPSRAMLDALFEHYRFFAPTRVVANGRDSRRFASGEKEPFVFSAGRTWDEAKNVGLLERIAPQVRWPLAIAGAGGESRSSGGGNITYLGTLASDCIALKLSAASIYAAPARYEPFGLGILEAAMSGCALVLGDIPSLRESWNGAARFVSPDDEGGWIAALNELCEDADSRGDLAVKAEERARHFTAHKMAAEYHDCYQSVRLGTTAPRLCSR